MSTVLGIYYSQNLHLMFDVDNEKSEPEQKLVQQV